MSQRDAEVQVSSNVTVTVLNQNNEVVQIIKKHNKATVIMVEGLLHFLQGWYTDTEYNRDLGGGTPEDSLIYVPTKLGFGNIGVSTTKENPDYNGGRPMFEDVNESDFIQPTFNTIALQSPLLKRADIPFGYKQFSDSELTSSENLNNSESLRLITRISPGQLVGERLYEQTIYDEEDAASQGLTFYPYEKSFYDPEKEQWCSIITEIGLFSDKDTLLARVLLDGAVEPKDILNGEEVIGRTYQFVDDSNPSNPIVQTEDTTLVIEWRIGLISVSDEDQFITQNSSLLPSSFAEDLSNSIFEYEQEENKTPTVQKIEEMINTLLESEKYKSQN